MCAPAAQTPRITRIKDYRLGLTYYVLCVFIFLYIVIGQLVRSYAWAVQPFCSFAHGRLDLMGGDVSTGTQRTVSCAGDGDYRLRATEAGSPFEKFTYLGKRLEF